MTLIYDLSLEVFLVFVTKGHICNLMKKVMMRPVVQYLALATGVLKDGKATH